MEFTDLTIADVIRLFAAVKKLKIDDPSFVQQVIEKEAVPADLPHPRITIGALLTLLKQTNGSTALPDTIATVFESGPMIQQLFQPAIIMDVTHPPAIGPETFEYVGTKVRIRRDSKFTHQHTGVGTVIRVGLDPGWVRVEFKNQKKSWFRTMEVVYLNSYRTGRVIENDERCDGSCDLELAEPLISTATIATNDGAIHTVAIPPGKTVLPRDVVLVHRQTRQIFFG